MTTLLDQELRQVWHILNAMKGGRLMVTAAGYKATGRPNVPVTPEDVTSLLDASLIERVGRGMYQVTPTGSYLVFNHKDAFSNEVEVDGICDDCGAIAPTAAVLRQNCRHHWLCANCRHVADSSGGSR